MALRKTIEFNGLQATDAYIRVDMVTVLSRISRLEFSVLYSADESLPEFHRITVQCDYDISGDNPVKQAYDYIKTLEEFAGSEYC